MDWNAFPFWVNKTVTDRIFKTREKQMFLFGKGEYALDGLRCNSVIKRQMFSLHSSYLLSGCWPVIFTICKKRLLFQYPLPLHPSFIVFTRRFNLFTYVMTITSWLHVFCSTPLSNLNLQVNPSSSWRVRMNCDYLPHNFVSSFVLIC